MPELRTGSSSKGFEGFETYVFAALVVRAETPDDVTNKLADAVRTAMHSPEGKAYRRPIAGRRC